MTLEQSIVRPSEPILHRITVPEFLALDEAGFFPNKRVELVDGVIYEMAPLHRPHGRILLALSVSIGLAVEALQSTLETLSPVSSELDGNSLPEADIIVAEKADTAFVHGSTVRMLVEVSDSSLNHDLGPKLRLYARNGVPEYWVADVIGCEIIRFHSPEGESYRERATFAFGKPVPSATIPGLKVDTGRLA